MMAATHHEQCWCIVWCLTMTMLLSTACFQLPKVAPLQLKRYPS
jgi:hypothetical protein